MPRPPQATSHGSWRYGALAALAIILIALGPHLYFFYKRGAAWTGTPPLTHGDEVVYAAYLNALIDGRPRRSDPYTGRDEAPDSAQAESYFSIQFLPPVVLAAAARTLGASSLQVFFALTLAAAAGATLALYRMLRDLMDDGCAAAAGAVAVLCLGSAHLWVEYLLGGDNTYNYLPFLRRYVPSFALPFLFLFCGLVWRMLRAETTRAALARATGAGACFAVLVYSYFYMWTAAAAWLVCLSLLWLAARGGERRESLKRLGVVYALAALSLAPYFVLLSNRVASTDGAMMLSRTHAPDLLRLPELIGLAALLVIVYAVRSGRVLANERALLFTAGLALTPFVVFNQQVLTGRSLQPFHYGMFGVNYLAAASALLAVALVWRGRGAREAPRIALAIVALVALGSGGFEALLAGRRHLSGNTLRDEARPAMLRLAEAGRGAGRLDTGSLILCTDPTVADALPTVAPQPVLWAAHMYNFPGVSLEEDKERLSLYLHLSGVRLDDVDPERFEEVDRFRKFYVSALIGRGRHNPNLRAGWTPIRPQEVAGALRHYSEFVSRLDRALVEKYQLTYVLTSPDEGTDFTNLDRWYERDAGERVGDFLIYRVKLRP